MGPHYLDALFAPSGIAVFGASERKDSVGNQVFSNLLRCGYAGKLYPINPKHKRVRGRACYPSLQAAPGAVDLALIAVPAPRVTQVIHQCGEQGVKALVVVSAGFRETGAEGERLERELRETAAHFDMRLLGPNCLGVIRPAVGINATFLNIGVNPGKLALVSQSGALCAAILDWAEPQGVGFSAVVSLGNSADLDFGDVLDFLAVDQQTRAILLYVEGIRQARRFMSGLRIASRMKPVIVIKAGRGAGAARATATHTGALVGSDMVFQAALERAGVVRAYTIGDLFAAAELLANGARVQGNRLTIVTNGGGPGALAIDHAEDLGVGITELSAKTMDQLDTLLPPHWSHANPVDILGDAPPERYQDVTRLCLQDPGTHGVLALLTPQSMSRPLEAAEQLIEAAQAHPGKPVLACWMGGRSVQQARERFAKHRLPSFQTPERAVQAFSYLARHHQNQRLLLQTPGSLSDQRGPDIEGARLIIEGVLAEGRDLLLDNEAKAVLGAFHIPCVRTLEASNATQALVAAESLGFPVAMKIRSPDISHKSDVGGVLLNIAGAQDVPTGFKLLTERVKTNSPGARILGVTIEPMAASPTARELLVGVAWDEVFGPVISFGAGGTNVEILRDQAVALPPLNAVLAKRLIERTRVAGLLGPYRQLPAVDHLAVENLLLRISELVCELPYVRELDINPLLADESGVIAVDVRMVVERPHTTPVPYAHMAIHPYPSQLATRTHLADGTELVIRPMRPEDADMEREFVRELSAESKYFRFMQSINELTPEMLVRFTQLDYDREMALVAQIRREDNRRQIIGVARYSINPDQRSCEFALVVSDHWHQHGIGSRLMDELFEAARARGIRVMEGEVLGDNQRMLSLTRELGFAIRVSPEDPSIRIVERRL